MNDSRHDDPVRSDDAGDHEPDRQPAAQEGHRFEPRDEPPGRQKHDHVVPVSTYVTVFVWLLALTGLTVLVARLDLGSWSFLHTPLALSIAVAKGLLVVLYFMHVRDSVRLTWVFIGAGLLWLAILIALTMGDYLSRDWEPRPLGWTVDGESAPPSSPFLQVGRPEA